MAFQDLIIMLDQWGFIDVLLPFILIFTLVFAVLQRTKILGPNSKQFNVIVALVMGLSVVIPHVTGAYIGWLGFDPVDVINASLPQVSIIVVAIVMMLIIIGVFGNDFNIQGTSLAAWVVILAALAVALIFGSAVGWIYMPDWLYFLNDPEIQSLVIMILVFGLIIWFITKEDRPAGQTGPFGKFMEDVGKTIREKK